MSGFVLKSDYKPAGDQPQAIEILTKGVETNEKHQTLLGVTGSGKTFTMANVIANTQRPTLIISHNKTLAAQLYQEFREFFPDNAVSYFVSYYDYYRPEAYIPQTDTYIEKETDINQEIDKLRLSATMNLMTRKDVIVVSSVSCIYNLGSPVEYNRYIAEMSVGQTITRSDLLKSFDRIQYERNEIDFRRGVYRVRGEIIEIFPAYEENPLRLYFSGDTITKITVTDPINATTVRELQKAILYPAKHYQASKDTFEEGRKQILADLDLRVKELKRQGKDLEAHRISQKTNYDMEIIQELGYCNGIENYSRYFDGRQPGQPPYSLLDYFADDYLLMVDESHITLPQIRGMYNGDQARKQTLIDFGFRLPSALDNRPLKFDEFSRKINQAVYVSATPNEYEVSLSNGKVVEQIIRPTGLVDPEIDIRPTEGQIDDLIVEVKNRVDKGQRVLVTTLTKRMAEDLSKYLEEKSINVQYLHSDITTLDRTDILDDLRLGKYDCIVGINLLREGLDLPEVSLVAILDADKEGFLRSKTSLIQTMGRAARHLDGRVIMYADKTTDSMQAAIDEVTRRRKIQLAYNLKHKITPIGITKKVRDKLSDRELEAPEAPKLDDVIVNAIEKAKTGVILPDEKTKIIKFLMRQMHEAANDLDFEKAIEIRNQIDILK
ncbi:excinuclease ABC subunit UvrB [Candidatus Curtissbacteria bacterium]|nr:excinuclease ABC subunit UvrB [Candidatus Curtissbacteria bacterium]